MDEAKPLLFKGSRGLCVGEREGAKFIYLSLSLSAVVVYLSMLCFFLSLRFQTLANMINIESLAHTAIWWLLPPGYIVVPFWDYLLGF